MSNAFFWTESHPEAVVGRPPLRADVGETFDELTCIAEPARHNGRWMQSVRCSCGATRIVRAGDLLSGAATSCGRTGRHGNSAHSRTQSVVDRFWGKVDMSAGITRCWPWTACRHPFGYGKFGIGSALDGSKKVDGAHRVALILSGAPEVPGKHALHECDNPPCCNPLHLYWGTPRDNVHDCMRRGRNVDPPRRSSQSKTFTPGGRTNPNSRVVHEKAVGRGGST